MLCGRIGDLNRAEGECEDSRPGSSREERWAFLRCGLWEKALVTDRFKLWKCGFFLTPRLAVRKQKQHRGAAPAHTARQHRGGFALMSRVGDGADCNQWLTEADNAGA